MNLPTISIYNTPGHVCPDTGRLCMTVAEAQARDDAPDRHFWRYNESAFEQGFEPWRELEDIEADDRTTSDGKPASYHLYFVGAGAPLSAEPTAPVYMQRTKAEREAANPRPPETKSMRLGDILTRADAAQWAGGGGKWREIGDDGHAGFAVVVWQTEDDARAGERSPACEKRARLLAASADMHALLRESLDSRDYAARRDWLKRTEALIERIEADK